MDKSSKFRRFFTMPQARAGMLMVAAGFPACWYFSRVTLSDPMLDMLVPVVCCAICLMGASKISRCIIALRMESDNE